MGFCFKRCGILAVIVVCLTAGGNTYAQSQPATLPESVTPPAKSKVKKRSVKKPSKELQAESAKQAKRRAAAQQGAEARAQREAQVQQEARQAREARENETRAQAEAEAEAKVRAVVNAKIRQDEEMAAREKTQAAANVLMNENKTTDVPAVRVAKKPRKPRRPAEVRSDILIGVAAMDSRKPGRAMQFGKFTGLTDKKIYVVGAANIQSQNGRRYWNLKVDDIALDTRSFNFDGGTMGKYKIHFGYSELDSLLSNNSQTPFNGAGGESLTLPAGFTKSFSTSGMTNLAASMQGVELGTKRKEGEASFAFQPGKNTGLSFSFRRYLKNGIKSIGAVVLPDLMFVRQGLVLPEPVNYHTDEFRTGFDWRGERGQANIEYYFSRFTNNDASLTWDNPFTIIATPGYPDQGRTSLPPDNQHQRLSLGGSYELTDTTRMSALYEQGTMTQNEAFLPYTINPDSTISTPLPRSSADARIDTTLVKFDLASRPFSPLSLHAGYRHYQTENKTPRDLYQMVINDTFNQVALTSIAAQYNQPYDSSRDQWKLDGSWYFGKGATLKLGFDRDQMEYRYRAVNATTENVYSARLNKRWDAGATAFLDLAEGRRRADGYDATRVFENMHTSQYLATLGAGEYFDSLPAMRQFDIADRDSARQGLGVTLLPRPDLAIGLNANHNGEKYNACQFGLQEREINSATLDATLTPDDVSSWSLYYTRQESGWKQVGNAYDWGDSLDPANDWSSRHQDAIDTVGVNITLSFLDDSLPVRLAYAYSNIHTDISFTAGSATIPVPVNMPTLKAERHTADLSGTYSIRDNLSVRVGGMVEFYRSRDWATDGISPGSSTVPEVLTLSGSAASYWAVLVTTALNYHF